MTDRPIIFSASMIKALLREVEAPGTGKTMTRRLAWRDREGGLSTIAGHPPLVISGRPSPWQRVQVGDRLWVRENIWQASRYPGALPSGEPEPLTWCWGSLAYYAADGEPPNTPNRHYPSGLCNGAFSAPDPFACWLKRPSIHMERKFSRLTLTITAVKRERLQEISEEDARAEGTMIVECGLRPIEAFAQLWDHLHGDGAWRGNPELICLTFTVALRNIDAKEAA